MENNFGPSGGPISIVQAKTMSDKNKKDYVVGKTKCCGTIENFYELDSYYQGNHSTLPEKIGNMILLDSLTVEFISTEIDIKTSICQCIKNI